MDHHAADPMFVPQRARRQRGPVLGLQTGVQMAAGVAVYAGRSVVRDAQNRSVVARPIHALDVPRVVVETDVLRTVHAPDDHVRIGTAAH